MLHLTGPHGVIRRWRMVPIHFPKPFRAPHHDRQRPFDEADRNQQPHTGVVRHPLGWRNRDLTKDWNADMSEVRRDIRDGVSLSGG